MLSLHSGTKTDGDPFSVICSRKSQIFAIVRVGKHSIPEVQGLALVFEIDVWKVDRVAYIQSDDIC